MYLKLHYGIFNIMKFIRETNIDNIPEEFTRIIKEFTNELRLTFPEYNNLLLKYTLNENPLKLYNYIGNVIIENHKNILSKNEVLFVEDTTKNTEFLPRVIFHYLWNSEISSNTQMTIWNYLTLLFVTFAKNSVDTVEDVNIDDILSQISVIENNTESDNTNAATNSGVSSDIPLPDDIPEAMKGLMKGNLGKLAMEMAKETISSGANTTDIFGMMSKIGSTIDNKIKSGEISESDLIQESMNMMNSFGPGNMSAMLNMFKKPASGVADIDMSPLQDMMEQRDRKNQKGQNKKQRQKLRSQNPRNMSIGELPEYEFPKFTDEELEKIFASK